MTKQDGGWEKTLALVIGSAIGGAVAFAACLVAFLAYFSSSTSSFTLGGRGKVIHGVPSIHESEKFLGTMGSYNGEFNNKYMDTVLESGPGQIIGTITVGGKPRSGVRIRLALNGAAMSQWGESAQDGRYSIPVPYGDYRVDGYGLDHEALNGVLGGKTDSPRNNTHGTNRFTVAEGKPGKGFDLDYVDPVVLTGPMGDVPASAPIVLAWKAYPNAATYRIALTEYKRPGDYGSQNSIFKWSDRPVVSGTSLDLSARGTPLQKGFYYRADIEALDGSKDVISTSGNRFGEPDFHVTE